jgi:hypothetical protein
MYVQHVACDAFPCSPSRGQEQLVSRTVDQCSVASAATQLNDRQSSNELVVLQPLPKGRLPDPGLAADDNARESLQHPFLKASFSDTATVPLKLNRGGQLKLLKRVNRCRGRQPRRSANG